MSRTKRTRANGEDSPAAAARLLIERRVGEGCPEVLSLAADWESDGSARLPLLAQLVHPLSPDAFVQRIYRSRVLATHGPPSRYAALAERLHRLSLRKLLEHTPSDAIHVWVARQLGGHGRGPPPAAAPSSARVSEELGRSESRPASPGGVGRAESFKTDDASAALTCHRAGASLYFRAPEDVSDLLVTALSQQLGMSFGALHPDGAPRSEVETFASRAGHLTDWHFDFMENFTLQLQGVKRWRLKRSGVAHPMRGCTPMWRQADATMRDAAEAQAKCHAQHAAGPFDPDPPRAFYEKAEEVVLRPGSMLYVPAGTWHRVECEENSLSINVSLMGLSWADLVGDALKQRLRTHDAARRTVCFHSLADGRAQLAEVLALLAAEAAALKPHDLLPRCMPLPRALRVALPLLGGTAGGAATSASPNASLRSRRFRRNPLAVLLLLPPEGEDEEDEDKDEGEDGEEEEEGGEAGEGEDDEEGEGGGGEEGEGEGGEEGECGGEEKEGEDGGEDGAGAERKAGMERQSGAASPRRLWRERLERLASGTDLLVDGVSRGALASWSRGHGGGEAEAQPATYALHAQFGNNEYASLLRVELLAPAPLWPLLEWCRTAAPPVFSLRQALEAAGRAVNLATVEAALALLVHNGFCARLKARAPSTS